MSAAVIPLFPKECPRCSSPVQTTEPTLGVAFGCTRCTWPNPSWQRVLTTLAWKGPDGQGPDFTKDGLESFVASLPPSTVLTDAHGRRVEARVFEVRVQDGHVEVVFEFDPNGWQVLS